MLQLTLGTGVGGGIVMNGEVWHGPDYCAAELGHVTIFPNGVKCGCGNYGCVEAYGSATALVRITQEKLDAGAEFAITQPTFDVAALVSFLDRVETYDRRIPVIAGIWPLLSFKNAEVMNNEVPGVVVPDPILERMSRCPTREQGRAEGIAIAREIIQHVGPRVAGIQVSAPLGNVGIALDVLKDTI